MTIKELVLANRSCRSFDTQVVLSRDTLEGFVDIARQVASGANFQPLRYYVEWRPEETKKICRTVKWGIRLKHLNLPPEDAFPPAIIVICHDTTVSAVQNYSFCDLGVAAQTILLAAAEQGLNGCMAGNFSRDEMRSLLRLPEDLVPVLVISLGKAKETFRMYDVPEGESIAYYRDEQGATCVPKRSLEQVLLSAEDLPQN